MDERRFRRTIGRGDDARIQRRIALRLLLDTHALIWAINAPERLDGKTRAAFAAIKNKLYVSAASVWEIAIKSAAGRLVFPVDSIDAILARLKADQLPITQAHGIIAARLPLIHRDPFDRMLIAQAQVEGLILVSTDAEIIRYDVRLFGRP